ncbi:MAG TPA: hypothetical protein VIM58_00530 [Candidatus Methylacidiphilales bacterium]
MKIDFAKLGSPVLLRGSERTAYRDPAAVYHEGCFHLFFTWVTIEDDGGVFLRLAVSKSADLVSWTPPRALTPKRRDLNYSSPGNIVRFEGRWVMCLQTYPRPRGEKWADDSARLFVMRSDDLETWDEPELLRVKGNGVPREAMGRMIDPYLFEDKDEPGKWWCSYKQDGVSLSWSRDLREWCPFGRIDAGENSCVVVEEGEYLLFHSPENGIGIKRTRDLVTWRDEGILTLGQAEWPWARGRLTAGFVLDLRDRPEVGRRLLFFHGSGPEDERTMFDNFASIGLAWDDRQGGWSWPRVRALNS